MKKVDIEFYDHCQKQLLIEDQHATICCMSDLLNCLSVLDCLDRFYKLESDRATKLAWGSAIDDIKAGLDFGTALYKTGLFQTELNTIFLIIQDYTAVNVAERYLKSLR